MTGANYLQTQSKPILNEGLNTCVGRDAHKNVPAVVEARLTIDLMGCTALPFRAVTSAVPQESSTAHLTCVFHADH